MTQTKLTYEQLMAKVQELEAKNAALEQATVKGIKMAVSEKGAVSITGLQRFPVTLYSEQWERVGIHIFGLNPEQFNASPMGKFIAANRDKLSTKGNPVSHEETITDAEFVVLSKRDDLTPAEQARINTYLAAKAAKLAKK